MSDTITEILNCLVFIEQSMPSVLRELEREWPVELSAIEHGSENNLDPERLIALRDALRGILDGSRVC